MAWVLGLVAVAAVGAAFALYLHPRGRGTAAARFPAAGGEPVRRILLPFTGASISRRAFDAAVRLARVEHATLMPCYLATVPLNLPLDAPLPRQCLSAMTLLEVIEQRAAAQGIPTDARISRGRTFRDALRREASKVSISTASSSRPASTQAPASPARTSSGCWTAPTPRS